MGTEWKPDEEELRQVLTLLENSQSVNTELQRQVQEKLNLLNGHERFGCYLAFILGTLTQEQVANRSVAGIILKNTMRSQWTKLSPEIKDYIRNKVLIAIGDESPLIRATVGIILTTVVVEEGVDAWPSLLPTLKELLRYNEKPHLQEGSLGALQKIFEDSGDRLDREVHIEPILPDILPFFSSPSPRMRGLAMNSINCILMVHDDPIHHVIDQFLHVLFARAHDDDEEVIKQLCRSLTLLLESHLEKMTPYLPNVIDYLITKTSDASESVALEACEFWLALAENQKLAYSLLGPFLPRLLPVLLHCMKYSQSEIMMMKADVEEEDAAVPDRPEDLKPRFHKSKAVNNEDDNDEDDDDDYSPDWSVRKCAAASLDVFSALYKDEFLPHLVPLLKEMLGSSEWEVKESAVLALGAVAEGCIDGMTPHLPELIPFLLSLMHEKKPLVRAITCWTLSRYCHFVLEQPPDVFFEKLLKELLTRILDGSKRVQEAACSAFATFEEEANVKLVPYLPDIIRTLVSAFNYYQARNLLILYDAVGTLADSVGNQLANPQYIEALMVPLMNKLQTLPEEDRELFPLLECIGSVATALGDAFTPYTSAVFRRCSGIITRCLDMSAAHDANPEGTESPDKDFLIVALDLISGLVSSLSPDHTNPLITEIQLVVILFRCAVDPLNEVRQSSFAVLGDLVKNCYHQVLPVVHNFIPILMTNLDLTNVSVCNNATWALGEIAIRVQGDMKQYATGLTQLLVIIMAKENVQKTLLENTAMTLGRLGIFCAEEVAPYLHMFIRPACYALRNIRDNVDKETAFRGLCYMINLNPQGVIADFVFLCDAIASWTQPPEDLRAMFKAILHGFRATMGDANWSQFTSQFPEILRHRLAVQYGL